MREPCAPGFAPLSSVLLPNVLLHFRSLGSLLSGMQTLRPPFDKRAYTGVIDGAVPLAFLAVAGEFMFALVPSPGEAQMFHAAVKEMGAHNWTFTEPEMQASLSIRARCAQVGIYLLNALGRDDGD